MQDPIKEARAGDPKAIQKLIQSRLNNPSLKVRVSFRKGQLQVAIVSKQDVEPLVVMPVVQSVVDQIAIVPGMVTRVKVVCLQEIDDTITPNTTNTNSLILWSEEIHLGSGSEDKTVLQEATSKTALNTNLILLLGSVVVLIGGVVFWWVQPKPHRVASAYMQSLQQGKGNEFRCMTKTSASGKLVSYELKTAQKNNPLATARRITNGSVASFASELNNLAEFVPEMRSQISTLARQPIGYHIYTYEVQASSPEITSPLIVTVWNTQDLRKFQKNILKLLQNGDTVRKNCQESNSEDCKNVRQIYSNLYFLSTSLTFPLSWGSSSISAAPIQAKGAFCVE